MLLQQFDCSIDNMEFFEIFKILYSDIKCVERNIRNKHTCLSLLAELHHFTITSKAVKKHLDANLWSMFKNQIIFLELAVIINNQDRAKDHIRLMRHFLFKHIVGQFVLKNRLENKYTCSDSIGTLVYLPRDCLFEISKYI